MSRPSASSPTPFRDLVTRLRAGTIDRRSFIAASGALGVGAGVAATVLQSVPAAAQGGTPAAATPASGGASDPAGRPAVGTESQTRGEGGELRLLSWQAASVLASHSSTGSKDTFAASLVLEPLMTWTIDGQLAPLLVEEAPTVENGLLSEDLRTATFTFLPDLVWSDGEPVTADDLVFTWQWVTTPDNASVNAGIWGQITDIVVEDERTAVVTFSEGRVTWWEPFVGNAIGVLYPSHVFGDDPANRNDAFLSAPIGTGPFVVESFAPNDEVVYAANEAYREPNKPYFSRVLFSGGGEAVATARAVVQTGEYDYAWNIQAEPELLQEINDSGDFGEVIGIETATTEVIYFNFSDPHTEVNGQRSEVNTPHPFLTDPAVREALNLAIDRTLIAGQLYGTPDSATPNVLSGNEVFESPNTSFTFDLEEANRILDEAGWVREGDTRVKDGVELSLVYATSVNQVRQRTQLVVQDALNEIGIGVELQQIDAAIFFDGSAGNEQNFSHFYWDIAMWSSGPAAPVPPRFMVKWYTGPDDSNIAQEANGWAGLNYQRYRNPDYDALYDQLLVATTQEEAVELLIAMNDLVITDRAIVPIVARTFSYAIGARLNRDNMELDNGWTGPFDNVANWNLVADV